MKNKQKSREEFLDKVGGLVPRMIDNYTGEHSTYMELLDNWKGIRKLIGEYYDQALSQREAEVRGEIADYLQAHFETALQDGYDLGKEAWSDDEPRVRVKWYLDMFIPKLRKNKKQK